MHHLTTPRHTTILTKTKPGESFLSLHHSRSSHTLLCDQIYLHIRSPFSASCRVLNTSANMSNNLRIALTRSQLEKRKGNSKWAPGAWAAASRYYATANIPEKRHPVIISTDG